MKVKVTKWKGTQYEEEVVLDNVSSIMHLNDGGCVIHTGTDSHIVYRTEADTLEVFLG